MTLKYGSRGDDVKNLQKQLSGLGYNLAADGIFGQKTLAAVKEAHPYEEPVINVLPLVGTGL